MRAALIARTVLAARWLGPRTFGAWNALLLLMEYGSLAPLGSQQGLDQSVPRHIVDADPVRLDRVKRAGSTNIVVLSFLFCAGLALYFARSTGNLMQYWGAGGLLLAMLVVLLINWSNYHTALLRSHGNIGAVSLWYFIQGMIGAVVGLALLRWAGGWGLLWGWVAGTAVAFLWARYQSRGIAPVKPLFAVESSTLLRIGFPIFFFLGSSLVIRSLDRVIILRFLGTRDLGFYSLAVTALTLLMYEPDSATFVLYPRLVQRFRAAGDAPESLQAPVLSALRVLTTLTPALGGLAFLAAPTAIGLVLPTYMVGAGAVRAMCFAAAALGVSNLASVTLMAMGRQLMLMPAAVVCTAAFATADVLVLKAGHGIVGVAWATYATYAATGALLLTIALVSLRLKTGGVLRELGLAFWGQGSALLLCVLADRVLPWRGTPTLGLQVLRVLLEWVSFLAAYALLVVPQLRGLGIRQMVSELNLPFASWFRRGAVGSGGRS